jgi:DNA-binding MarR family transcriptional regulator
MTGTRIEPGVIDYLTRVTGETPWIEPIPEQLASTLPLYLRQRYEFFRVDLFARRCILARETSPKRELSPTEYGHEVTQLKQRLHGDVVLVLTKLPSYVRNRLVRQRIPFIVPGTQMFLPMLMIDLREQFPKPNDRMRATLSAVSQLVVICQILKQSLDETPLGQIAARLGYSAMTLSKTQHELQTAKLCEVIRTWRTVRLHFTSRGRALWTRAEPLLTTPVRRRLWIRWGQPRARAVLAGTTALSKVSMVADDRVPTYAMRDKDLTGAMHKGEIFGCGGPEEAEARMEAWNYDPWVLADNDVADRCSLYLSLRHSNEERIQKGIRSLIDGIPQ